MINGIPIQFLDGISDETNEQIHSFVGSVMKGYTADVIDDLDTVMNGYDLLGIQGDGSTQDSEKLRAYLIRTKSVADRYPQSICGYQNPETFSKMLGYVLNHWDTANREQALEDMAHEEERLAEAGKIDLGIADDDELVVVGEVYETDDYECLGAVTTENGEVTSAYKAKKNKNGFFNQIKKLNQNLNISSDANKIVASNPYFNKKKNELRKQVAQSRKAKKSLVTNGDTHQTKVITQNVATTNGLDGVDDELQSVLCGADFLDNLNGTDKDGIKNYLLRTKYVLENNPKEYFNNENEANKILGSLEYAIGNIDDPKTAEAVLTNLSGEGMNDDEYGLYLQTIGTIRRQGKQKAFFKRLKSTKTPETAKMILKEKAKEIAGDPDSFSDQVEYENVMGVFGYAIENWDNPQAVDVLCGIGMSREQYDEMENSLGAIFSKKDKATRTKERKIAKAGKTISRLKKAYLTNDNSQTKSIIAKQIEAEQNALNGKKLFSKVKNAVKKATKAVATVAKKAVTAPIKVAVKTTKAVTKATVNATKKVAKATVNATKKVAQTTAKVAKKAGQAIKKAVKKIVKFVIKYNPITLVARAIILMACSLNMFKMAERMYPATLSETEAISLGLTSDQYQKSKECYEKLKKAFTKIGGKESKLVKYLQKGSKKVWKGSDSFDKNTLKDTALKNQKNINTMYDEDEAELKKQGATSTDDPNVTYSETKTEVEEVQETAVEGLYGLIENGYVQFGGLGVIATATIASGSASASGILAGILAKLKGIFGSGKLKQVVKNVASKVKEKAVNKVKNVASNTKEKIQETKEKIKNSNIKDTAKSIVTTTVKNMITPKQADEVEQQITATNQKASGTNWKKVALVGGGIVLLGGLGVVAYNAMNNSND